MILLEATNGGAYDGIVILIFAIMFGPALLLAIIGGIVHANKNKKAAKILYILAGVYLLISLGTCSSLLI